MMSCSSVWSVCVYYDHLQLMVMTCHSWEALEPSTLVMELQLFVESQHKTEMNCHHCGTDH